MRIESGGPLANLARGVQRQNTAAERDPEEVRAGLRVSLSELGRNLSAGAGKSQDIDDSDLPKTIKELLKMIRELKAQIVEKQAEIAAAMGEQNLTPAARRLKLEALQGELANLGAALALANASLVKLMRESGLSDEQMRTAASLAMR